MIDFQIKAIDIHSHYNNGSEFDTYEDALSHVDPASLKQERLRLGVEKMACCSFGSVTTDQDIIAQNDHCHKLCQGDDFFYQWAVIDPKQKETFAQAERLLRSDRVLGLKIHPQYHKYTFLDYAEEIFSFASEFDATVLMHLQAPEQDALIADKYPNTKLIIAHLGWESQVNAVRKAKHGNVFVDTSGSASNKNNVIEYAVSVLGADNILFGTDTYSCAFQKGRILLADIRDEDKEKILYQNAQRLFGL